jgi:hypothetical protein
LLPTSARSGHPRYSARKAIALWIIVSASIWLAIGAFFSSVFDGSRASLDAEADRLSKITPAAGGAAPKP